MSWDLVFLYMYELPEKYLDLQQNFMNGFQCHEVKQHLPLTVFQQI